MGIRPPIGILLYILVLWVVCSTSVAQDRNEVLQTIQEMPSRQADALAEIAGRIDGATLDFALGMYFLDIDQDEYNQFLREYQSGGTTLPELSVILRLLHTDIRSATSSLDQETKTHLENEIGTLIEESGPLFQTPMDTSLSSESQRFLSGSNLVLWSDYVHSSSVEFSWPKSSNTENVYWQLYPQQIHDWLDRQLRTGPEERSSPYYSYYLAGLLNLRDFPMDEQIQIKADAIIDFLLTDIAQESIHGKWGGVRSRTFELISQPLNSQLHPILFGEKYQSIGVVDSVDPLTYHVATTGYRPPSVIVRLANSAQDRGSYQIHNSFHYHSTLFQENEEYRKSTYVTPNYILSSFQLHNQRVPWQSRVWDLMVHESDTAEDHIFSFAGDQFASGGKPPFHNEYFRWNASCYQYKNVLYVEYHRSDRKRDDSSPQSLIVDERFVQPSTRLWIPNTFTPVVEENGWWFSKRDGVYLAFRPVEGKAYWWRTVQPSTPYDPGASILNFQALHTGCIIEVEEEPRFSSFEQFKQQVLSSPLQVEEETVTFVTRRGDVLLFPRKQGTFLVNGKPVESQLDHPYELVSSPYAFSKLGSGKFEVEWEPFSLMWDFTNPEQPKRIAKPEHQ